MAIDWQDVFRDTQAVLYRTRPYYKSWFLTRDPHDAIFEALQLAPPKSLHQLVLECGHAKSEQEPDKINYLRSEAHIEPRLFAHKWTETPLSKYLAKHFPQVPSHHLREITSKYAELFDMVDAMPKMLEAVILGPKSCMQTEQSIENALEDHPYLAYDPKFGWAMARHVNVKGEIVGRAIVHKPSKTFVRTYGTRISTGQNQESQPLNSWLTSKGYKKARSWPEGIKLAWVEFDNDSNMLVPFIDGDLKFVTKGEDHLVLDPSGRYKCGNTDGSADERAMHICADCNTGIDDDDGYGIGYDGDQRVCANCIDDYVHAYGRYGDQYYVPVHNATQTVEEEWYHDDYFDRNGVEQITVGKHRGQYTTNGIELYDGNVAYSGDGDDDVVELSSESEESGKALYDDTFYCEYSEEYFLMEEDGYVQFDNGTVAKIHIEAWLEKYPEYREEYEASLVDHTAQQALPLEEKEPSCVE